MRAKNPKNGTTEQAVLSGRPETRSVDSKSTSDRTCAGADVEAALHICGASEPTALLSAASRILIGCLRGILISAGFDAQDTAVPQNAVAIHHPHGNIKRISYANGS